MGADSLTWQLAHRAQALRYEALPAALTGFAKTLVGDLLLVAAAGAAENSTRAFSQAMGRAPGSSQLWFDHAGRHLTPADATFANTLSAAALDYDSLNGTVHADLVTLPAAWAMAEHCQRSPRQMLLAYIAASEWVSRLARCAVVGASGWSGTSLYGGMGAALASGLLLGLSTEQLVHAQGLAVLQAAGSQQANIEQTLAKRLQPAFAARNGVQAALLAKAGATAPQQALEGRFGLWALYQRGDDVRLLAGWGEDWQLLGTALKGYPVCACSHAALKALIELRQRNAIDPRAVVAVVATISPFMNRLVGGGFNPGADLQVLAQFNLRYQLASVLLRGPFTLEHLRPEALLAGDIAALLPRISIKLSEVDTAALAPASVQLSLDDGRVLQHACTALPGSPEAPLNARERQAKARECGSQAAPPIDGGALLTVIEGLDLLSELPRLERLGALP